MSSHFFVPRTSLSALNFKCSNGGNRDFNFLRLERKIKLLQKTNIWNWNSGYNTYVDDLCGGWTAPSAGCSVNISYYICWIWRSNVWSFLFNCSILIEMLKLQRRWLLEKPIARDETRNVHQPSGSVHSPHSNPIWIRKPMNPWKSAKSIGC